jgi:two-component system NtrC family sensor kinase
MKIAPLIFCLLALQTASAQNKKIDSINILINKATTDTARINLTNKKIEFFGDVNFDSAIKYSRQNVITAQKINYNKGIADAKILLGRDYAFKGMYDSAANNLNAAGSIYFSLNDSNRITKYYSSYGVYYGLQAKYDSSINYFKKSMVISDALHDISGLNKIYQNIAIDYQMLSNSTLALEYYQKALKVAEQGNDTTTEARINLNMGVLYKSIGDTARALKALTKAIDFAQKTGIKITETYAYANRASVYADMHLYQQLYRDAIQARELAKQIGDKGIEASSLSRAALGQAEMKNYSVAEPMADTAISIANLSKQPLNIYQTNSDKGKILRLQQKYSEAIPYFEKAIAAMENSDFYERQFGTTYFDLSECYQQTGNYEQALFAFKKYAAIEDSVVKKENVRKATELTLNYEFDKKQQVVKAEQQKKDEVAKTKQGALIVGLILMLILVIVAFNGYKNKQKANRLLTLQKQQIEGTLSELKTTQAQLIQSEKMASLGELTAGIAHEIQNPLNFVNNFSDLNKELLGEMKDEIDKGNTEDAKLLANNVIDNEEKINYHGKRAEAIVKGMLQHSRKNNGIKEATDINALADEYLRLSYHGLRAKDKSFNADFKTDFDETIGKINIVPQDIGRVLLNLFNNAFYAVSERRKAEGEGYKAEVSVQTKKINGKVEISVKDNGSGISQSVIDKIFQPFFTTKPTGEGTGLGLSLSYDIITKEHNGTIKVETKKTEGTTFIIQLPIV